MNKAGVCLLSFVTLVGAAQTQAQEISPYVKYMPTQSDMGGVGLLQMPSARMNKEGELSLTYFDNEEYRRMAVSLQLLPWLETTIRYNDVRTRLYSDVPSFSGDQTYKDRGVDVKARLLEESYWLPEVSIGLRDFAGTGQFSGEFIAASKRWHNVDFTLGIGWGYLGRSGNISNPFCELSDGYCDRPGGFKGQGGSFEYDEWFKGAASIFGGVEYQTPWDPLILKLEYDGNDYSDEASRTPIEQDSNVNFGLHYRVHDNINIQVSYERGNTLMFGFSIRSDLSSLGKVKQPRKKTTARDIKSRQAKAKPLNTKKVIKDLNRRAGWGVTSLGFNNDGKTFTSKGYRFRYRNRDETTERATRVLLSYLPDTVETIELIDNAFMHPMAKATIDREQAYQAIARQDIDTQFDHSVNYTDVNSNDLSKDQQPLIEHEHKITWPRASFRPYIQQSFGGPENFYMYDLRADLHMNWSVTPKTIIEGIVATRLSGNYDDFNFLVDNYGLPLPRVRTYIREYVSFSDVWLENLQATHFEQINNNWYASIYGGYFERMFAGVGSEVMYRPYEKGWGVGMELNAVKQRSFESHFGFRDYQTLTGHLHGYWKPSFMPNSMVRVSAGRFLAKDWGAQVQFEHKFDSGVIVGAYATKTNVSAEDYGEGSFNKGFYISLPFDIFQMENSVGRANIGWTPITRDGGQMLRRRGHLIGVTDVRDGFYGN